MRLPKKVTSLRTCARNSWSNIRKYAIRCKKRTLARYICPASWLDLETGFAAFIQDVGMPPNRNHFLVRRDKSLPWSATNTYWSPSASSYKRQTMLVSAFGLTMPVTQWANELCYSRMTLYTLLSKMTPEEMVLHCLKQRRGLRKDRSHHHACSAEMQRLIDEFDRSKTEEVFS